MEKLSLGENRIRIDFRSTENQEAKEIKLKTAELINLVDGIRNDSNDGGERARLKALAITQLELASMWATKAATA